MSLAKQKLQRGVLKEGREGGLPIPFPSHHFFPNPTNQCPDPTDMLTKHQSHSHFGFFFLTQIPVPATEIPFSQYKNRLIPVPILPLHDPLKSNHHKLNINVRLTKWTCRQKLFPTTILFYCKKTTAYKPY